ncbi:MAG: diaminopimelate decarboxylase, partial [Myxococcota bacterium]
MNHFEYHDDELYCENVSLATIAREVGTPTFVYSHATLTRHYRVFDEALGGLDHLICYSVKANSNLAVLKLLLDQGAGADVVSGGELQRVLRAGGDAKKIVFSGVGKRAEEMRQALRAGILMFNVESR